MRRAFDSRDRCEVRIELDTALELQESITFEEVAAHN